MLCYVLPSNVDTVSWITCAKISLCRCRLTSESKLNLTQPRRSVTVLSYGWSRCKHCDIIGTHFKGCMYKHVCLSHLQTKKNLLSKTARLLNVDSLWVFFKSSVSFSPTAVLGWFLCTALITTRFWSILSIHW